MEENGKKLNPQKYSLDLNGKFLFIRHGQTICNSDKNYKERKINENYIDSHLSENGIKQTKKLKEKLDKLDIEAIYVSPLYRSLETAKYLIEDINYNGEIIINPLISECPNCIDDFIFDINETKKDFEVMDIRNMEYPNKSFDCIMCFGTLIHLNDDDCLNALKEFDRILNDKGILAINVMEHLSGDREIVVEEPFNNNYQMYYNRYPKSFFIDFFKENNYIIIKEFDNPIYNEDSVGDDLTGTNEFSIIARKNN